MSNGSIAASCCCGENGCATECCDWWACSPAGPITVTLTGSAVTNRRILPGTQVLEVERVEWSITATMTRSGSSCAFSGAGYPNLYRFTAQTCTFSYLRRTTSFSVGELLGYICFNYIPYDDCCGVWTLEGDCATSSGGLVSDPNGPLCNCDGPLSCNDWWALYGDPVTFPPGTYRMRVGPNPCTSWNCCRGSACADGFGCDGPAGCQDIGCPPTPNDIEFRRLSVQEWSFNGTLTGYGSCGASSGGNCLPDPGCLDDQVSGLPINYAWLVRPTDVLTIVCLPQQCKPGCVKPAIFFTPDVTGKMLDHVTDRTMDPCCPWPCGDPSEQCYTADQEPMCILQFYVTGSGSCLNAATFDAPNTGCGGWPVSSWFTTEGNSMDMAGIGCNACAPLNQTRVLGSVCNDTGEGKAPYYCAVQTEPGSCPSIEQCVCGSGEGCTTQKGSFDVCYWPAWCEQDERTTAWTWTM